MPSTQKTYQKYDLVAMGRLSIIPPSATRRPNSSFSDAGKVRYAAFNSAKIDSAYASASPDGAQNSSPRGESANLVSVIEFAKDAEARKLLLGAKQDLTFEFSANSFLFTADVVTKLDKF
ncbi:hypothetical protein B0H13DRAFT_2372945 [Mycena leptocephala]|nr:hypothetical protein B0H13DRAFT_2372945 [Mycena leptocephala]